MRRMVLFAFGIVATVLTLVGFAVALNWPLLLRPASPRMEYWNGLFMQIFWIALVVGILVWGLLVYALIRFRAKPGGPKEGPHIHGNTKMEIAWTIAPALVMGWLLVVSYNGLFAIENDPPNVDTTIKITGFQFGWNFEYEDGTGGTGPQDPIWIEQNRFVKFEIRSQDVIHAFSVPELGLMKDAIPGRTNYDWVQPTHVGNFSIKCRELCGAGHSYMLGTIVVFPEGAHGRAYGPPPEPEPTATTSPSPSPTNTTATNATLAPIPEGTTVLNVTLGPDGTFTIDPDRMEAPVGPVVFDVVNAAGVPHNLFIGAFDASKPAGDHGATWKTDDLSGGQRARLEANFTEDATYEFWCDISGHRFAFDEGMSGLITVGEGGEPPSGGPKPLLPGFGAFALVFAVAALVLVLRRRA